MHRCAVCGGSLQRNGERRKSYASGDCDHDHSGLTANLDYDHCPADNDSTSDHDSGNHHGVSDHDNRDLCDHGNY